MTGASQQQKHDNSIDVDININISLKSTVIREDPDGRVYFIYIKRKEHNKNF